MVAVFQKDYTTAERYFELASLQSPRSFVASNDLALALIEQEDKTKQAPRLGICRKQRAEYTNGARRPPGCFDLRLDAFQPGGNLDEAEKWLQAAVSSGQVTPDTAYYCARLAKDRNRDEVARQWLENALKSPSPFAYAARGHGAVGEAQKIKIMVNDPSLP